MPKTVLDPYIAEHARTPESSERRRNPIIKRDFQRQFILQSVVFAFVLVNALLIFSFLPLKALSIILPRSSCD